MERPIRRYCEEGLYMELAAEGLKDGDAMKALIVSVLALVLCFFVQRVSPFVAGLVAVVPIKIIGTAFMVHEDSGRRALETSLSGMLVGQVVIAAALAIAILVMRRCR